MVVSARCLVLVLLASSAALAQKPVSRIASPEVLLHAQRQCCPPWLSGDRLAFDRCCMRFGFCPICDGFTLKEGCWYGYSWYPVGALIEANPQKCYEIRCLPAWPQPAPQVVHIAPYCGCCEYYGRVYIRGHILNIGACQRRICRGGRWIPISPAPGSTKPCPPGYITYNQNFCLYVWPVWMPWYQATRTCGLLGGRLALPLNFKENQLILDQLNGTAGWLGTRGGKWPTVRTEAWNNKSPWDTGSPPKLRAEAVENACLGIALGRRGWSALPCVHFGRPICLIPRVPCPRNYCLVNGRRYRNGAQIARLNVCERIVCRGGYPMLVVSPKCCYFQGSTPIGKWAAGHFMYGSFSPYKGLRCYCRRDRTVTCCYGRYCLYTQEAAIKTSEVTLSKEIKLAQEIKLTRNVSG